jgi:class 3 adenylate cyclase
MARWDTAAGHFEDALAFHEEIGAPAWVARTQVAYASVCVNQHAVDETKAAAMAAKARDAARRLGLPRLAADAHDAMRIASAGNTLASSSIEAVLSTVLEQRPVMEDLASRDLLTIMFTDIAGSVATAERLGDERWVELVRAHNRTVRDRIERYGGREVANRGDGFMIVFSHPEAAVKCAIDIQRTMEKENSTGSREPLRVHMGLHAGKPVTDEDNFYGKDVNLAARLGDNVAKAGQIIVSATLRGLIGGEAGIAFGGEHSVELKGLSGRHTVAEVVWK